MYHVINRGNYKSDVFADQGAAHAFVKTLEEATERFGWRVAAYVVMRNHYHIAIQTPEPNLSTGMHWLQCTFATRFNRLRSEHGHLFQGRYKAILLETAHDLARVADYIHLNPLRAQIVAPSHLTQFRWSSLMRFSKNHKFNGLTAIGWLGVHDLQDLEEDWSRYTDLLLKRFEAPANSLEYERVALTEGWAVGSDDWKAKTLQRALADSDRSGSSEGLQLPAEMLEMKWRLRLDQELGEAKKSQSKIDGDRKSAAWKIAIAERLQREAGVSATWLATALNMGKPSSVRAYLWRSRKNQRITT